MMERNQVQFTVLYFVLLSISVLEANSVVFTPFTVSDHFSY